MKIKVRASTEMNVTVLANSAAQALGYSSLKEHQIEVVLAVISACKKNICYAVSSHSIIFETFNPLLEKIKLLKVSLHRVIIYCRRLKDCSMLYKFF